MSQKFLLAEFLDWKQSVYLVMWLMSGLQQNLLTGWAAALCELCQEPIYSAPQNTAGMHQGHGKCLSWGIYTRCLWTWEGSSQTSKFCTRFDAALGTWEFSPIGLRILRPGSPSTPCVTWLKLSVSASTPQMFKPLGRHMCVTHPARTVLHGCLPPNQYCVTGPQGLWIVVAVCLVYFLRKDPVKMDSTCSILRCCWPMYWIFSLKLTCCPERVTLRPNSSKRI